MIRLYPSLIAANQLALRDTMAQLAPYCHGFHLDVMDNHFVPNLTWGPLVVNALAAATTKHIWVHLMVENPQTLLAALQLPPQSIVSFHIESTTDIKNTMTRIKEKNWSPSLAISPKTALSGAFPFLDAVDQVLVMSVEPGASGQPFIPDTITKIKELVQYRSTKGLAYTIGVDGGLNTATLPTVAAAGGLELVVGAAVFNTPNPIEALKKLAQQNA